jgi:hypothetical protein
MKNPRRNRPRSYQETRYNAAKRYGPDICLEVKQSQTPASSRVAQQLAETIAKIKNRCQTDPIQKGFGESTCNAAKCHGPDICLAVKQSQTPAVAQQLTQTGAKIKNRCESNPLSALRQVFGQATAGPDNKKTRHFAGLFTIHVR